MNSILTKLFLFLFQLFIKANVISENKTGCQYTRCLGYKDERNTGNRELNMPDTAEYKSTGCNNYNDNGKRGRGTPAQVDIHEHKAIPADKSDTHTGNSPSDRTDNKVSIEKNLTEPTDSKADQRGYE